MRAAPPPWRTALRPSHPARSMFTAVRTLFKFLAWSLAAILLALVVAYFVVDEGLPEGQAGARAEALADQLLAAVDAEAWDRTDRVAWTFGGRHHLDWRRDVDSVRVTWRGRRVDLHTETVTGRAWEDGVEHSGATARELVDDAWAIFCNDAFWLAAPYKVRDPGTERRAVALEDGREGLLVTYTGGGVTPGDSYLWILRADGRPEAWRMWTSILPVGGVRATWEGWQRLPSGALVSTRHDFGPLDLVLDVE